MRDQWCTREAAHIDSVREFVDQRHCKHEGGAELLGGRRRGKGVGVQGAEEAGGDIDQGVRAAEVKC
jgi:hypothetical protein